MITAIVAILIFLLVVFIHELGHFLVAKLVGIRVNEFAIGMGPKLFSFNKGETKYSLRALPIGGYVKMEGEDEQSKDPRSFNNVSVWKRISVTIAGAFMNIVLAIIALSIVAFLFGKPTTTVDKVLPNSPATEYLESGDTIVAINDKKIETWDDILSTIGPSDPEELLQVEVIRNGENLVFEMYPKTEGQNSVIGIMPQRVKNMGSALSSGIQETWESTKMIFAFFGNLIVGKASTDDLSGPVGIVTQISSATKLGWPYVILMLGLISLSLGIFNILPIPALDGGRIVFLLIELIRGKPINPEKEGFVHLVSFVLLLSLMLLITFKDIAKLL